MGKGIASIEYCAARNKLSKDFRTLLSIVCVAAASSEEKWRQYRRRRSWFIERSLTTFNFILSLDVIKIA